VAEATCLVTGAGGAALESSVCLPCDISIVVNAFTPGQVLNFGSLAYVADCYGELHLLKEAEPVGNESGVDPETLTWQI
jgi:hypothetical protein